MKYKSSVLLKNKKTVLFDLDGTLVSSMWVWKAIDVEYLGRYGAAPTPELNREIEGMGFTETAQYFKRVFNIPDDIEVIKKEWNDMAYDKYVNEVKLKPGAGDFIKKLHNEGYKLGIASSNSIELIEGTLKANGVWEYFDAVTTSCEAGAGKPAPDIYLLSAKKLGVEPEECLVFEDIPMGIMAGKNAGMTVCTIEDDYSAWLRDEKTELADYFIDDYWDIEWK